jgi:hypothetical protein
MTLGGVVVLIQNVGEARQAYEAAMGAAIVEAFRKLLTEKHLYQSENLDDDKARRAVPPISESLKKHCEEAGIFVRGVSQYAWLLRGDEGQQRIEDSRPNAAVLPFTLPHAKLYCSHCKGREVFNVVSGSSAIKTWDYALPVFNGFGTIEQVYQLVYLCQGCRKFPEVFLVRRTGGKLRLSGRSPIEHYAAPAEIPEPMWKHYSGAVVAYQSGQVLAGLFMLRVAIEQWMRKWAEPEDKADFGMRKYMESLPAGFSDKFPSLQAVYGKLSEDIHAATGSREIYVQAIEEISRHFKARLIYPDVQPPPK